MQQYIWGEGQELIGGNAGIFWSIRPRDFDLWNNFVSTIQGADLSLDDIEMKIEAEDFEDKKVPTVPLTT